MKAVIVCDDLAFVVKASKTLQRVGCQPGMSVQWTTQSWPLNALNQAAMAENTLVEAADAHLIIIPAHHADSLPFLLLDWLERWASVRQIRDAALAVIADDIDNGFGMAVSSELNLLVQKHGLSFITDAVVVAKDSAKSAVRFFPELKLPLRVGKACFEPAVTYEAYRRYGINE